jgi:hypothetical protein
MDRFRKIQTLRVARMTLKAPNTSILLSQCESRREIVTTICLYFSRNSENVMSGRSSATPSAFAMRRCPRWRVGGGVTGWPSAHRDARACPDFARGSAA